MSIQGNVENYNETHINEFVNILGERLKNEELVSKIKLEIRRELVDNMTLVDFNAFISNKCSTYIGYDDDIDWVASYYLLKNIYYTVDVNNYYNVLMNIKNSGIISDKYVEYCMNNIDFINSILKIERDNLINFFGLKTMASAYFIKDKSGVIIESPQHTFLREAIQLNMNNLDNNNIYETYEVLSLLKYTHATPTLHNSGTKKPQLSSCFLMQCGDSMDDISKAWHQIALISKWGGGIGINLSNVRGRGSIIHSNNGVTDGILKLCKVLEAIGRYVNQCFTGGVFVYTEHGMKKIKNIVSGEKVLTCDGSYKRVVSVSKNTIDKEILEISVPFSFYKVSVTKEHLIFVKHDNGVMDYIHADEITNDTKLCMVIPSMEYSMGDIRIDKDMVKLLGCIFVSGYYNEDENVCGIHLTDMELCLFEDFLDEVVNKYAMRSYKIGNIYYIVGCHDYIHYIYNGDCMELSDDIKNMNFDYMNEFLDGIFKMKLKNERNKKLMSSCVLDSEKKANEILEMLLKVGRYRECLYESDTKLYHLEFYDGEVEIVDNKLFFVVEEIVRKNYSGNVYDLNIEDNHNYMTCMGLVHNSGKRPGSIAVYLEPWHSDIEMFCDLRRITGDESERTRDLFLGLWIPDLFMRKVMNDEEWYLMTPDISKGLTLVYGNEFDELYTSYVNRGMYVKKVMARDIYRKIQESQFETGMPYMLFKDACNIKSNQKNIGVIQNSNLCTEIVQYSDNNEIATCNLASISLPKYIVDGTFDFEELGRITRIAVRNLNNVIDVNYYAVDESKVSNMNNRAIGLGVQGLIDVYQMMGYAFDSLEALDLNKKIFECIYYYSLYESMDLARKYGKYVTFDGSPYSEGILQFHMCGKTIEDLYIENYPVFNWYELIEDIKKYGTRNSLITSIMPTASTSQMMGNYECIEPYASNLFLRKTGKREFIVINKHLVKTLKDKNLWNRDMYEKLIYYDGSVQDIDEIDDETKRIYKTAFELQQKHIVTQAIDRGAFIDQSQSMNIFMEDPDYDRLEKAHFYGWKNGLKTGIYYLRSKPASSSAKLGAKVCYSCSA